MSITKEEVVSKIEILEEGQIQVRKTIKVLEDGVEIASSFHRHVILPGADTDQEDDRVKAVVAADWTPKRVSGFQQKKAARKAAKAARSK